MGTGAFGVLLLRLTEKRFSATWSRPADRMREYVLALRAIWRNWEKGEKLDFLRKQVLTSRNVRGGGFTDLALGGLNYQIEHHLFPSMPSPHLAKAQPIVRDYCAEIGVPYHETGFVRSHVEAVTHMHRAGAPLRARTPA